MNVTLTRYTLNIALNEVNRALRRTADILQDAELPPKYREYLEQEAQQQEQALRELCRAEAEARGMTPEDGALMGEATARSAWDDAKRRGAA